MLRLRRFALALAAMDRSLAKYRTWPDMMQPVIGCMAGSIDRHVFGSEIQFT